MNKKSEFHPVNPARLPVPNRQRRAGRPATRQSRGRANLAPHIGEPLSKEAARLLAALSGPDTEGLIDPIEDGFVLVRKRQGGVSVGAGRFGLAAAEALARHDLAHWTPGRGLRVTGAGRAHQRRREAGADESPFSAQHATLADATIVGEGGPAWVRVNAEESPLDWLRRRKGRDGAPMIDEASYLAGERLRADITFAGLLPGVTARWEAPNGGGASSPGDATDRMVAARQRIRHAFEAVGGDLADLLIDLCGFLKGLELIERERHWPPRSGKVVVRLALARLAEHYGLETVACGPKASRGIRSWQAVVIEGGRNAS